jgi:hypothetical protein
MRAFLWLAVPLLHVFAQSPCSGNEFYLCCLKDPFGLNDDGTAVGCYQRMLSLFSPSRAFLL